MKWAEDVSSIDIPTPEAMADDPKDAIWQYQRIAFDALNAEIRRRLEEATGESVRMEYRWHGGDMAAMGIEPVDEDLQASIGEAVICEWWDAERDAAWVDQARVEVTR